MSFFRELTYRQGLQKRFASSADYWARFRQISYISPCKSPENPYSAANVHPARDFGTPSIAIFIEALLAIYTLARSQFDYFFGGNSSPNTNKASPSKPSAKANFHGAAGSRGNSGPAGRATLRPTAAFC
ncbi:MAG: hypothetical protein ACKVOO_10630 [Burkholderiaceae bacterium]